MSSRLRLFLSALVSFVFYAGWAYWANMSATDDANMLIRTALVQGSLSGSVTLLFTFALEQSIKRFGTHKWSLMFVVPILCSVHSKTKQNVAIMKTFNNALDYSAEKAAGACLPGSLFAPLLPLLVQASLAIGVNVINNTPNLWLTVAPSIFFTGLYGYVYTFTLLKQREATADVG